MPPRGGEFWPAVDQLAWPERKHATPRKTETGSIPTGTDPVAWTAQEYLATDFDWRVGVLDRRPLFACKYFMALTTGK